MLLCSRLRCSNTGSCLGAELLAAKLSSLCASCLSHAGWWQGMRFSWGSSAKEPPGFLPLSGVLDLASVMTCTEGSVSREKSLCWSHLFRLPAPVLPRIMEINPLPASLCPVSPHTELRHCCFLRLWDATWVRLVASTKR